MEHNFKKKFGQNFLKDTNLLNAIVQDGGISTQDEVLEIGAGAGALTKHLSLNAKRVVSYEIDLDLKSKLLDLGLNNVKFIFKDALKEPIEEIENNFEGNYKLVANLPYYITSPLIFKFLQESKKLISMTIMVQKEVAERIIAKEGGKDYGILSVMTQFYSVPKICRIVSRQMFYPAPNVDSAVVNLELNKTRFAINEKEFYEFIKKCFSMRRKTLLNNLQGYKNFDKKQIGNLLKDFDLSKRPETFSLEKFVEMFKKF